MTGYHLTIGYISGYVGTTSKEEAFQQLALMVEVVRGNPWIVRPVNSACKVPWSDAHAEAAEQNYPIDGPALRVRREDMEILMCCSGGGPYRRVKEECAFHTCMYLICAMANLGIPVNMVVT